MPWSCYSYPADMPASTPNRDAVQANLRGLRKGVRRMPFGSCFRY